MSSRLKGVSTSHAVEINGVLVTPAEVAAKAQRLRAAVVSAVSEVDMATVMQTMVTRAQRGDMFAARLLLQVIGAAGPAGVGNVVQVNVGDTSGGRPLPPRIEFPEFDPGEQARLRKGIASILVGRGCEVPLSVLANELEIPRSQLPMLLDCDWFEMAPEGARLTSAGRKELVSTNGKARH